MSSIPITKLPRRFEKKSLPIGLGPGARTEIPAFRIQSQPTLASVPDMLRHDRTPTARVNSAAVNIIYKPVV